MKGNDAKLKFIQLRAENKSYSYIANELKISKSTCTAWDKELKEIIAEAKKEQLQEMYEAYHITKKARVKKLGETLNKIDQAITDLDFSEVPPEKLLQLKLKYLEALKDEYVPLESPYKLNTDRQDPKDILNALADLLERVRSGEITGEQANKETAVLISLLKAYDIVEVKAKLEAIETALGSI